MVRNPFERHHRTGSMGGSALCRKRASPGAFCRRDLPSWDPGRSRTASSVNAAAGVISCEGPTMPADVARALRRVLRRMLQTRSQDVVPETLRSSKARIVVLSIEFAEAFAPVHVCQSWSSFRQGWSHGITLPLLRLPPCCPTIPW